MPEIAKSLTPQPAAAPAAPAAPASGNTPGAIAAQHRSEASPAKPTLEDVSAQIPALDTSEPANDNGEVEPVHAAPEEEFDPWSEKIRGELTAKQLIDLMKSSDGLLPQELLDLEHEFVFGEGEAEERQRLSLKDALDQSHKERMQLRDYSKRRHELHQAQRDLSAKAQALQESIESLNDPRSMFDVLLGLGVSEDSLFQAAQAFAVQQVQLQKMPPEMRQMIEEQRRLRVEHEKTQRELREYRAKVKETQDREYQQHDSRILNQHVPTAFQKFGLNRQSAIALEKFKLHAIVLADGKPLTRDVIYAAAEAASQDLHGLERQEKQRAVGKPLAAKPAAAPAALKVPSHANGKQRGFTPSQWADLRNK